MDIHYNAFISYRHHPEDIRVATEIHRALERYHIPKAVRKNQKGSLRLFRDKDELPITSNLTDDITRALENSDFLIVICSTHTKESIWVQREIETFLKTHTYDKVLTVLVDGEPYDTIPEILQYREEPDPDTGEVERILIEPLSCDWRVGKKIAYREELPRLAAALLHCGYDELRQRQRQYKMRRMVTFFSLALAASVSLMAYFLYTSIKIQQANDQLNAANQEIREANEEIKQANVQIQNNLDDALRNQSEYLASAAGELYDNGDRLTAISLAMAALPSEDNDRPYVADAEKVLSKVLGLYSSSRNIESAGVFDVGVVVSEFVLSDDGKVIYLLDQNKRITVWDTDTYEQLGTILPKATYIRDMKVAGQSLIISMNVDYYSGDPELCSYDISGNLCWSVKKCSDFALLDDDTVMVLLANSGEPATIGFFDLATGVRKRDTLLLDETGEISLDRFCNKNYTEDIPVILEASSLASIYFNDNVVMVDLDKGTLNQLTPYEQWPEDQRSDLTLTGAAITEQGNILVMMGDGSGIRNGRINNVTTTSPANRTLLCYDGTDGSLMWQTMTTAYSYSDCFTLCSIPGTENIFCQAGNAFFVIEEATGTVLSRCECTGNVLSVYPEKDSASGLLDSGHYFEYTYDTNLCMAMPILNGSVVQAEVARGYFFLESLSNHVTLYLLSRETGWTAFRGDAADISVYKEYSDENLMAVLPYDDQLLIFDTETQTILSSTEVEGRYRLQLLGFSEDKTKFYYADQESLLTMDVATGEVSSFAIQAGGDGVYASITGFYWIGENTLYYMIRMEDELYLAEADLKTLQGRATLVMQDTAEDNWRIGKEAGVTASTDGYAWLWNDGTLYEFDRENRTFRVLLEGLTKFPLCQYHREEGILSVCTENSTVFFSPGEGEILRIEHSEYRGVSVQLYQNDILMVNDKANLLRYDWQGNRLSEISLNAYSTFFSNINIDPGESLDIDWAFSPDGELILGLFNMGNIIDCSQWQARAYIENYEAYDAKNDVVICSFDGTFGFYPRYTTQQVLSIAREQLGTYELSEDDKAFYGIG